MRAERLDTEKILELKMSFDKTFVSVAQTQTKTFNFENRNIMNDMFTLILNETNDL